MTKQIFKNANGVNAEVTLQNPDTNYKKVTVSIPDIMAKTDTIATLRAKTEIPDTIYVTGYHTANDGAFGSHFFRWNSTSKEDDNGGTIIKLDSVETGRYELQYDGAVNVKWFGAVDDISIDSTDSIIKASNYLSSGDTLRIQGNFGVSWSTSLLSNTFNNISSSANGKGLINISYKRGITIDARGGYIKQLETYNSLANAVPYIFVNIENSSDTSLLGLTVDGNREHSYSYMIGVQVHESKNTIIKECRTYKTFASIVFGNNVNGCTVDNNIFNVITGAKLIQNTAPADNLLANGFGIYSPDPKNLSVTISNNYFGETNFDGIEIDNEGISATWGKQGEVASDELTKSLIISGNRFVNILENPSASSSSHGLAIGLASQRNIYIYNNNVFESCTIAIAIESQKLPTSSIGHSSSNITISGNKYNDCEYGIRLLTGASSGIIDKLSISDEYVTSSTYGIYASGGVEANIYDNFIDSDKDLTSTGIYLNSNKYINLNNNTVDNATNGVKLYSSHQSNVENNFINGCDIAYVIAKPQQIIGKCVFSIDNPNAQLVSCDANGAIMIKEIEFIKTGMSFTGGANNDFILFSVTQGSNILQKMKGDYSIAIQNASDAVTAFGTLDYVPTTVTSTQDYLVKQSVLTSASIQYSSGNIVERTYSGAGYSGSTMTVKISNIVFK